MSVLAVSPLPPDALELLNDPRLADLRSRGPGMPPAGMQLTPSDPPPEGESRFVTFQTDFEHMTTANVEWVNQLSPTGPIGRGRGFPTLSNATPRFRQDGAKPRKSLPGAWSYSGWLIASPHFATTLRSFDPAVIETVEIDWCFADGEKLDGYVFLDVTRLLYAYDYRRSVVHVRIDESGKYISSLGTPSALRPDLPVDVHVFRDAYWRSTIFFSRELATALHAVEPYGFHFSEPATGKYFPKVT